MVGAYTQWLVSNSGREKALEDKKLAGKFKDRVYDLSAKSSSTTKIIIELKTTVQGTRKVSALKKLSSGYTGV